MRCLRKIATDPNNGRRIIVIHIIQKRKNSSGDVTFISFKKRDGKIIESMDSKRDSIAKMFVKQCHITPLLSKKDLATYNSLKPGERFRLRVEIVDNVRT